MFLGSNSLLEGLRIHRMFPWVCPPQQTSPGLLPGPFMFARSVLEDVLRAGFIPLQTLKVDRVVKFDLPQVVNWDNREGRAREFLRHGGEENEAYACGDDPKMSRRAVLTLAGSVNLISVGQR
eukprot:1342580-Amphidinium_carterae.2